MIRGLEPQRVGNQTYGAAREISTLISFVRTEVLYAIEIEPQNWNTRQDSNLHNNRVEADGLIQFEPRVQNWFLIPVLPNLRRHD